MKIKKSEIVKAIDKVKSVVPKKPSRPALGGVLVCNGNLIAANQEMTIQVKLDSSEGELFIIPEKAFDLIKNLPEGDLEILCGSDNVVTIRMDKIKNSYQSFPADDFIYNRVISETMNGIRLPGELLMESLSHVSYAAADKATMKPILGGIYMEGGKQCLNLTASDGHVLCWDQIQAEGASELKLIVPKPTVKKLTSMDVGDEIEITYDKNGAIFKGDDYAIYTRIIDGAYMSYKKLFYDTESYTIVNREELIGAMTRAKMCTDENSPAIFEISGQEMRVMIKDSVADYQEKVVLLEKIETPFKIGFDSRLVLESIKAFTCENITLNFSSPVTPMIIQADDSDMKALVLPVKLKG